MATFTPNKGYSQPVVGGDIGQWGTELNTSFSVLDNNMGGTATVSVAGGSNVTATAAQAQCLIQNLTGTLTSNINYILPALGSFYAIENNTSGNFLINVISSGGGSGILVPQGQSIWVFCDGTNILPAMPDGWQVYTTITLTGVSAQNFALPQAYRRFRLTLQQLSGSTANIILLTVSTNGGSSFIAANYNVIVMPAATNGTTVVVSSQTTTSIQISNTLNIAQGGDMTYEMYAGNNGTFAMRGSRIGINGGGAFEIDLLGATNNTGATVNMIRLTASTGTWNGTVILEGLPA